MEHFWQTMISFVIKPYVRRDVVCASWWGKEKEIMRKNDILRRKSFQMTYPEIMGKRAAHAFMLSAALVCERG